MTTTTYRYYADRMQVTVPVGEYDGLEVEKFEVKGPELWNLRAALDGRECQPGTYTRLIDRKETELGEPVMWMSDTTAERDDHKEPVACIELSKAETVLINGLGLGLGMVLAAALTYDHVKLVDVIESDERVIKLIGPHYTTDPRVNIIHADAYEQTKAWPRGSKWDIAWSDIWPDLNADNIPGMDQLHAYYRRRTQWHGCWGRKTCLGLRAELRRYGLD